MRCHHERLLRYHATVLRKPVSKDSPRLPPEFSRNSCGIDRVSHVMAGAIGNKFNEGFMFCNFSAGSQLVQKRTNRFNNVQVCSFTLATECNRSRRLFQHPRPQPARGHDLRCKASRAHYYHFHKTGNLAPSRPLMIVSGMSFSGK